VSGKNPKLDANTPDYFASMAFKKIF